MAQQLKPCCQKALDRWLNIIAKTVTSYPVIQDRPCPTCRTIIKVRVYQRPEAA